MKPDKPNNKARIPVKNNKRLIYIGEGIILSGIPARDMTTEEADKYGGVDELLKTGLYATPEELEHDGG